MELHLLSGDKEAAVKKMADNTELKYYMAAASPEDKMNYIKKLQEQGKKVVMCGDGINDAGAMAQADLSIAMGSGSEVAMETGDIVLLKSSIHSLYQSLMLTRKAYSIVKENLFWAFAYNVVMIPLAAGIFFLITVKTFPPMYSSAAMGLSSISVVLNSMRLRYLRLK
jgi:Cu2+-exporting ATPase